MILLRNLVFPVILFTLLLNISCSYIIPEPGPSSKNEKEIYHNSDRIVAVDQFGRSFNTLTSYKSGKQVGMFFWLWIGQPYSTAIYDATKISEMPNGNNILYSFDHLNDSISPNLQAHFWGEPLWGYYNSDDEWVIRRQIQMLTIAGIDFIVFDATNSVTYPNVYRTILKIITEYIDAGWNPPRAAFYTHSRSITTTIKLYNELYKKNIYPDAWYRLNGKPFIIAYKTQEEDILEAKSRQDTVYKPQLLPTEILNYFTFSKPQWPMDPVYPDGFPWIEWEFPQPLHRNVMSVTVASHPNVPMSRTITRGVENWGRGWDPVLKKNISENVDRGTFFQLQWDHALEVNPDVIFVGGWNEWIAIKQPWGGEYMLCDAANKEFSRDIEPMNGGYQDAFYIQLIQNIRKYKGIPDTASNGEYKEINVKEGLKQWESIRNVYVNTDEQMISRDAYGGAKTVRYKQSSPENKLQKVKVCHDNQNIYFLIQSDNRISLKGNSTNIFIGTGDPSLKGWESYEYVTGRINKNGSVSVEKLNKDFSGSISGTAEYLVDGKFIQVKIPRSAIGLNSDVNKFYFKIADGINNPADIMDYYKSGISMPMGRLSYLYKF